MGRTLEVRDGLPPDWSSITDGAPPQALEHWVRFGLDWLPGRYRSFVLREAGGEPVIALGGAVIENPDGLPRRNPYHVLSGGTAVMGLATGQPHPWAEVPPAEAFPCLSLQFPNDAAFLVGPGRDDPEAVRELLAELIRWARAAGVRSVGVLYLPPFTVALTGELVRAGFAIVDLTTRCDLDVTWTDFGGYLSTLPSKRRIEVARERRQLTERKVDVSVRGLLEEEPEIVGMRCQLATKYGATPDPDREAGIIDRIRRYVPPSDVTVFGASAAGRMVGFGLFIQDGDVWTAALTGADYTRPESAFGYFSTMFYEPVAHAPRRGIRQIAYGSGSWDAKRRRGCRLTPLRAAGLRLP